MTFFYGGVVAQLAPVLDARAVPNADYVLDPDAKIKGKIFCSIKTDRTC
jgi:hypothetical protein